METCKVILELEEFVINTLVLFFFFETTHWFYIQNLVH